ncbi:MAG: MFS transporter [Bryobacterales bacterium]|nr:MFS transporter [Bryobacterales bacterium]
MKIAGLRWWIAGLLFLSTVINYVDRQTLSIVAPQLTKELGLTPVAYSNILNAFLVAYTLMYLGSGVLVDRWGTRIALAAFVGWWSVSNMLHAFARTAVQLGFVRLLLGLGEPGNFMAAAKAISEWYRPSERAFVNGLVQAGASVGAVIAPPLVVWITKAYGWQTAFVATGALGLFWLAAWLFLYRLPKESPLITPEELALLEEAQPKKPPVKVPWASLLGYRQTWGLLLGRFFSDPVWWFYLFWLPKFLVDKRGFSLEQVGMLAWLPYLTADLGSISGGVLSGALVKRNWEVVRARSFGMWPFALLMPLSLLVPIAPNNTAVLAIICVVTFAHMAWKTNIMTITNDIYPTHVVGSLAGIVAFGNGLGGTLFTWLVGWIVQYYSYDAIFVIMGFMHPTAYLIFRWLVRGPVVVKES